MTSPHYNYIYVTEVPSKLADGRTPRTGYLLGSKIHQFLARYSKQVVYTEIPETGTEPILLNYRSCQRIGKAMQTHTDVWEPKITTIASQLELSEQTIWDGVWRLRGIFLEGKQIQIQELRNANMIDCDSWEPIPEDHISFLQEFARSAGSHAPADSPEQEIEK